MNEKNSPNQSTKIKKLNNIALKISNLSFRYSSNDPLALADINTEIKEGEYVVIIGHNGSGKSTLSKLVMGVLNNQEGKLEIFGNEVNRRNLSEIRNFLGIVFQNPDNQFIGSTVQDDIAFGLQNRQIPTLEMHKIVQETAKQVDMLDYLNHEPLMLSGGQKQKVAIASALALNPAILIFDEATSMLDPKGIAEVKGLIAKLKEDPSRTIISITHDMNEIVTADKVLILNKGQLVRSGTPKQILKDEAFLKSIQLDVPFLFKVINRLQDKGVKISKTISTKQFIKELKQQM